MRDSLSKRKPARYTRLCCNSYVARVMYRAYPLERVTNESLAEFPDLILNAGKNTHGSERLKCVLLGENAVTKICMCIGRGLFAVGPRRKCRRRGRSTRTIRPCWFFRVFVFLQISPFFHYRNKFVQQPVRALTVDPDRVYWFSVNEASHKMW